MHMVALHLVITILCWAQTSVVAFQHSYAPPRVSTACWGRGRWRGFRHMKTFRERRWSFAWTNGEDELDAPPRSRRTAKYIPDDWEDITGHYERRWKCWSKRRHQWEPKKYK